MKSITIIMSVYRPNLEWLEQQLESIQEQTWPCKELLIRDDCPQEPVGMDFFARYLTKIPFQYEIGQENLGPSRSFASMIERAQGDYIAFCDQDDRWKKEKLETLEHAFHEQGVTWAYCGQQIIDAQGNVIGQDIHTVRKGDFFLQGNGCAPDLFVKNCIYGCTMLLPANLAKQALPLPEEMTHDHWFSLWAASKGKLVYVDKPLVEYRLHGNNQSAVLKQIHTKQEYIEKRIKSLAIRTKSCKGRFTHAPDMEKKIREVDRWVQARLRWQSGDWSAFPEFWGNRRLSPKAALFEVGMPFLPWSIFRRVLSRQV